MRKSVETPSMNKLIAYTNNLKGDGMALGTPDVRELARKHRVVSRENAAHRHSSSKKVTSLFAGPPRTDSKSIRVSSKAPFEEVEPRGS